jgi:hypothetical protein
MSYQLNRAHLLICIFAGLVLCGGFVWHIFFRPSFTLFTMALWVSSAIVLFYFVGKIVRSYLISEVFVPIVDDYNFEEDEEYQAFVASLENNGEEPADVMLDDPLQEIPEFDDLNDPFMEPISFEDAS